jgi:hypothetical protein
MDAETLRPIGDSSPGSGSGLLAVLQATPPKLRALISQFPEVVNELGQLPPVKHVVQHAIVTTGRPVTSGFGGWTLLSWPLRRVSFCSWRKMVS